MTNKPLVIVAEKVAIEDLTPNDQVLMRGERDPETLGDWLTAVSVIWGTGSAQHTYLLNKIAEPGESLNSPVVAHPQQMFFLLRQM